MKTTKLLLSLLIVASLLFVTTSSALADGGDDGKETPDDYIGQVSATTSDALPNRMGSRPGIQPNAVNPAPGGGYAIAQATLAWAIARMDVVAETSLTSDVQGTYSLCATATQVYKDGVPRVE